MSESAASTATDPSPSAGEPVFAAIQPERDETPAPVGASSPGATASDQRDPRSFPPAPVYEEGPVIFTTGRVFEPLVADPRYPRFSAYYNYYLDHDYLGHMGTVSFGETIAFFRDATDAGNLYEFGIQGAVYGLYDVGDGNNHYNADWYYHFYYAFRQDDFSFMARTYHDSGHLGDEFILKNPEVERENFVLDGGQVLLSYDVNPGLRVYGGPAWFWSTGNDVHDEWLLQWGVEVESPDTIWGGLARPIAAADIQHWEGRDFQPDLTLRGGLRFEQPHRLGQHMSFLFEYYTGRERNGQFITNTTQHFGFGVQFQL